MASTRASTGHSKPRVQLNVSTEPERKRATTSKRSAGHPHHGGVKKRTGGATTTTTTTTTTSRAAPATHHKRKPHLSDKIEGAAEKLVGKVTRRPGKKAAGTRKMRGTDGKGGHKRI